MYVGLTSHFLFGGIQEMILVLLYALVVGLSLDTRIRTGKAAFLFVDIGLKRKDVNGGNLGRSLRTGH